MVSIETRNSYSEVFELLKQLKKQDVMKIPVWLLETIKENRNKEYSPKVNLDDIDNSLSRKAKALYIGLYLKYICDDQKEKDDINKILYDNEIEAKSKVQLNDMFKNRAKAEEKEQHVQLIEYKENIFMKIINKIKNFFSKEK